MMREEKKDDLELIDDLQNKLKESESAQDLKIWLEEDQKMGKMKQNWEDEHTKFKSDHDKEHQAELNRIKRENQLLKQSLKELSLSLWCQRLMIQKRRMKWATRMTLLGEQSSIDNYVCLLPATTNWMFL